MEGLWGVGLAEGIIDDTLLIYMAPANRWSVVSHMVRPSVRPLQKQNKTRENATWGLVDH